MGIIAPDKEATAQADRLLKSFAESHRGEITEEERFYLLNQILSSMLELHEDGLCVYAFSGSDTTYVDGLRAETMVYADNDPKALADAKVKRPSIATLEVNLFGGLPKEFDGRVDLLVERNFCGEATFTLDMFISSISDGGYYLLWKGENRDISGMPELTISPLRWNDDGAFSVAAEFSSMRLNVPDSLGAKLLKFLKLPQEQSAESIFPWLIYKVKRY